MDGQTPTVNILMQDYHRIYVFCRHCSISIQTYASPRQITNLTLSWWHSVHVKKRKPELRFTPATVTNRHHLVHQMENENKWIQIGASNVWPQNYAKRPAYQNQRSVYPLVTQGDTSVTSVSAEPKTECHVKNIVKEATIILAILYSLFNKNIPIRVNDKLIMWSECTTYQFSRTQELRGYHTQLIHYGKNRSSPNNNW